MMTNKKGTLIVTGGTHGIGEACVKKLKPHFSSTSVYDIQNDPKHDVRDSKQLQKFMKKTLTNTPDAKHALVISAGVLRMGNLLDQTEEDIRFVIDTNLTGALLTLRAFLKWHQDNKHKIKPNIVVVSSISAFYHGGVGAIPYEASKAGLSFLVKDVANFPCYITGVQPGTIRETALASLTPNVTHDKKSRDNLIISQRTDIETQGFEVTKEQIAKLIKWLLLEGGNELLTGHCITPDGGQTVLKPERF
jgi:NAD(P)-dependent dehydrogenase (short-subunit alcohol dehydrogenase family)